MTCRVEKKHVSFIFPSCVLNYSYHTVLQSHCTVAVAHANKIHLLQLLSPFSSELPLSAKKMDILMSASHAMTVHIRK